MKRAGIIVLITIPIFAILVKSGMVDSLMLFILGGIVPGTNFVVPSTIMLLIMASAAWLILFSFVPSDTFSAPPKKTTARQSTKNSTTKATF